MQSIENKNVTTFLTSYKKSKCVGFSSLMLLSFHHRKYTVKYVIKT